MIFRRHIINILIYFVLFLLSVIAVYPVIYIAVKSFAGGNGFTFQGYKEVFFMTPEYLIKFWISLFISAVIMAGQLIISCLGGYGFAKFKFPFKNVIFYFMIILLIMPIQVMMTPNYILFDKIGLIDSYASLILPGIFSTFGVFLLAQIFSSVPDNLIEAAKIDGANHMKILFKIVMPHGKAGVAALITLNFIDSWSMVEQPLAFLKDTNKYPLSIFLSKANQINPEISFVCAILAVIPSLLLFLHLKDSLIYGIENANLK